MIQFLKWVRKRLLSISLRETTFTQRGFREGDIRLRQQLEHIGRIFLMGYHAALNDDQPKVLARQLNAIEIEWRGFAFEGAAMGLALLDYLTPWKRNRLQVFLEGPGAAHSYMVHVGVGWVLARFHLNVELSLQHLDPLLRWLTVDGYGFHEGYFHWQTYVERQIIPTGISDGALHVFDQGLGRSLWFVDCADVNQIPVSVAAFSPSRQADLWSGVGLACAYAGGVERAAIEALRTSAGSYLPQMAQGAVFAAKARQRASNPAMHTELACQILCGMSAEAAAEIADITLKELPTNGALTAYEVWRRRIQKQFASEEVKA